MIKKPQIDKFKEIIEVVSNAAMGDYSQRIKITGEDEVAALGIAINEMIDNIVHWRSEMTEEILSVVSDISMGDLSKEVEVVGEDEFAALGSAINEMNSNLKHYNQEMTEKILTVVSDVSMGDFSKEIDVSSSGEASFEALGEAINEVINILRQSHERLKHLSEIDPLTNIPNRRHFFDQLEIDLERAKRYSSPMSLAMIDLDFFKKVNDTYGHLVGDEVLKETAKILRNSIRKADVVGRYGGEEFVIAMVGINIKNAQIVCEKLCKAVENYKHSSAGTITISIGVAELNKNDTVETLIARADKALYAAKEKGRNRTEAVC